MARRLTILVLLCAAPLALAAAACGSDDGSGVREVGTDGSAAASGSASGSSASGSGSGRGAGRAPGCPWRTPRRRAPATRPSRPASPPTRTTSRPRWTRRSPRPWSSPTPCAPGTCRRPARPTRRAARAGSGSSRSPGWWRPSTARSTPAWTTSPAPTTRSSPGGTASSTSSGGGTPPRARRASPTASTATSQTLKTELATLEIPPAAVALGASELIEEVSAGKITGEEDRYSKTDLWDFNANVEGAEEVIASLAPALEAADPGLLQSIETGFDEIEGSLAAAAAGRRVGALLPGERRVPFPAVPRDDRDPGADRHDEGPAGEPLGGPGARAGSARPVVSRGGISRRAFLAGAGGAAVGGGLLAAAACGGGSDDGPGAEGRRVAFAGPHQAGITLEPAPAAGLMASFAVLAARPRRPGRPAARPHRRDRRAHGGAPAGGARPRLPADRLRDPRARPAARRPDRGGERRRLPVRRALRPGRPPAAGARDDAVRVQRPPRPRAQPRRPAAEHRVRSTPTPASSRSAS